MDLAEQRSTRVVEEFGHKQRLVAVDADAADAQGVHKQIAVGAATNADEAVAATAALEHGVRVPIGQAQERVTVMSCGDVLRWKKGFVLDESHSRHLEAG